jgi:hypothetical protein
MSARCQAVVRTGAGRSPTLITDSVKGGDLMPSQLIELSVSWIIGGAILRWWFKPPPNGRSVWMDFLYRWTTAGFFLIFGCAVLLDLPEPLLWAGLVWMVPPLGLTVLVIVSVVLMVLDALVFARWSGARARRTLTAAGMLFPLFEDRPKSKRKRKPKAKRKNDWL